MPSAAEQRDEGRDRSCGDDATRGDPRTRLRDAVRVADRRMAQSGGCDEGEIRAAWRSVFEGHWSPLDRFDADGRRFLIARRATTGREASTPLSARESRVAALAAGGHANKWIASVLGISPASVSRHLASAARKLGLGSRVELVGLLSSAALADGSGAERCDP